MNYKERVEALLPKLPRRMTIRFAVYCAKSSLKHVSDGHRAACETAIALAERVANGESIPMKDLEDAAHAASAAHATYAAYATYATYAAHAAHAASAASAASAAYSAAYAASAAYNAANAAHAASAAHAARAAHDTVYAEFYNYLTELISLSSDLEKEYWT